MHGHLHGIGDGLVTAEPGVTLDGARRRLRPGAVRRRRGGRRSAPATAGVPGSSRGSCRRRSAAMRELGARDVTAWVGPHVCGRCYEVPQEMQDDVAAVEPVTRATTSWGTPSLDVGAGVRAQLAREGLEVVDLSRCTMRVARPLLLPARGQALRPPGGADPEDSVNTRRDEIAAGLDDVRRRIADAATAAGRGPDDVTLVVVTKFFPASDVRLLAELGVTDVGENRHPEAGDKLAECGDLGAALALHRRAPEQQGRRCRFLRGRRRVGRPREAGERPQPRGARALAPRRRPAPGEPRPAGSGGPLGRGWL